jgi:hypothetical protein
VQINAHNLSYRCEAKALITIQELNDRLIKEFGIGKNTIEKLKLPTNRDIGFLADDPKDYIFETLTVDIVFPNKRRIVPIKVMNLLSQFPKPYQANILSHITYCLEVRGIKHIKFPKGLANGGALIGAAPDSTVARLADLKGECKKSGPLIPE